MKYRQTRQINKYKVNKNKDACSFIPSQHSDRWAVVKRFSYVFRVHNYLTKAVSRTKIVSIESPWAGDDDNALFRFIPIGCSRAMTCWIWSARVKNGSKRPFSLFLYEFLTRGISRSSTLLVRLLNKLRVLEEPGTRTWSCWLEASFDALYVSFNWVQGSETGSCLLSSAH